MGQNDNRVYPKLWTLYWGTLDKGFTFFGPFKSYDEAWAWSTDHLHVGTISHIVEMFDVRNDL